MPWNDGIDPATPAFYIAADGGSRIRVLAGPGTGKSFAIKKDDPPAGGRSGAGTVLAVTFTRLSARISYVTFDLWESPEPMMLCAFCMSSVFAAGQCSGRCRNSARNGSSGVGSEIVRSSRDAHKVRKKHSSHANDESR